MTRRLRRSLSQSAKSPSALLVIRARVTASGLPSLSMMSASSGSSGAAPASTMAQNAGGRRRFRFEAADVALRQIRGYMADAAGGIPAVQIGPISVAEPLVFLAALAPDDKMPAVIGRDVDAVGPMVGRDDDGAAVDDRVFA